MTIIFKHNFSSPELKADMVSLNDGVKPECVRGFILSV